MQEAPNEQTEDFAFQFLPNTNPKIPTILDHQQPFSFQALIQTMYTKRFNLLDINHDTGLLACGSTHGFSLFSTVHLHNQLSSTSSSTTSTVDYHSRMEQIKSQHGNHALYQSPSMAHSPPLLIKISPISNSRDELFVLICSIQASFSVFRIRITHDDDENQQEHQQAQVTIVSDDESTEDNVMDACWFDEQSFFLTLSNGRCLWYQFDHQKQQFVESEPYCQGIVTHVSSDHEGRIALSCQSLLVILKRVNGALETILTHKFEHEIREVIWVSENYLLCMAIVKRFDDDETATSVVPYIVNLSHVLSHSSQLPLDHITCYADIPYDLRDFEDNESRIIGCFEKRTSSILTASTTDSLVMIAKQNMPQSDEENSSWSVLEISNEKYQLRLPMSNNEEVSVFGMVVDYSYQGEVSTTAFVEERKMKNVPLVIILGSSGELLSYALLSRNPLPESNVAFETPLPFTFVEEEEEEETPMPSTPLGPNQSSFSFSFGDQEQKGTFTQPSNLFTPPKQSPAIDGMKHKDEYSQEQTSFSFTGAFSANNQQTKSSDTDNFAKPSHKVPTIRKKKVKKAKRESTTELGMLERIVPKLPTKKRTTINRAEYSSTSIAHQNELKLLEFLESQIQKVDVTKQKLNEGIHLFKHMKSQYANENLDKVTEEMKGLKVSEKLEILVERVMDVKNTLSCNQTEAAHARMIMENSGNQQELIERADKQKMEELAAKRKKVESLMEQVHYYINNSSHQAGLHFLKHRVEQDEQRSREQTERIAQLRDRLSGKLSTKTDQPQLGPSVNSFRTPPHDIDRLKSLISNKRLVVSVESPNSSIIESVDQIRYLQVQQSYFFVKDKSDVPYYSSPDEEDEEDQSWTNEEEEEDEIQDSDDSVSTIPSDEEQDDVPSLPETKITKPSMTSQDFSSKNSFSFGGGDNAQPYGFGASFSNQDHAAKNVMFSDDIEEPEEEIVESEKVSPYEESEDITVTEDNIQPTSTTSASTGLNFFGSPFGMKSESTSSFAASGSAFTEAVTSTTSAPLSQQSTFDLGTSFGSALDSFSTPGVDSKKSTESKSTPIISKEPEKLQQTNDLTTTLSQTRSSGFSFPSFTTTDKQDSTVSESKTQEQPQKENFSFNSFASSLLDSSGESSESSLSSTTKPTESFGTSLLGATEPTKTDSTFPSSSGFGTFSSSDKQEPTSSLFSGSFGPTTNSQLQPLDSGAGFSSSLGSDSNKKEPATSLSSSSFASTTPYQPLSSAGASNTASTHDFGSFGSFGSTGSSFSGGSFASAFESNEFEKSNQSSGFGSSGFASQKNTTASQPLSASGTSGFGSSFGMTGFGASTDSSSSFLSGFGSSQDNTTKDSTSMFGSGSFGSTTNSQLQPLGSSSGFPSSSGSTHDFSNYGGFGSSGSSLSGGSFSSAFASNPTPDSTNSFGNQQQTSSGFGSSGFSMSGASGGFGTTSFSQTDTSSSSSNLTSSSFGGSGFGASSFSQQNNTADNGSFTGSFGANTGSTLQPLGSGNSGFSSFASKGGGSAFSSFSGSGWGQ